MWTLRTAHTRKLKYRWQTIFARRNVRVREGRHETAPVEAPWQREVREEENGRCGRKRGGPPSSQGLEATMAVRLLAPWSLPDTPSSANAARTRLSSARRSSIRRDIAIHTSERTLFTVRDSCSERGSND